MRTWDELRLYKEGEEKVSYGRAALAWTNVSRKGSELLVASVRGMEMIISAWLFSVCTLDTCITLDFKDFKITTVIFPTGNVCGKLASIVTLYFYLIAVCLFWARGIVLLQRDKFWWWLSKTCFFVAVTQDTLNEAHFMLGFRAFVSSFAASFLALAFPPLLPNLFNHTCLLAHTHPSSCGCARESDSQSWPSGVNKTLDVGKLSLRSPLTRLSQLWLLFVPCLRLTSFHPSGS